VAQHILPREGTSVADRGPANLGGPRLALAGEAPGPAHACPACPRTTPVPTCQGQAPSHAHTPGPCTAAPLSPPRRLGRPVSSWLFAVYRIVEIKSTPCPENEEQGRDQETYANVRHKGMGRKKGSDCNPSEQTG
jgi:hypothetical protein